MRTLTTFSTSVSGPPYKQMANLYLTMIRPAITYACQVWFLYAIDMNQAWSIRRDIVKELETLQYHCLLKLCGAMVKTSYDVLLAEFKIERLEVFLDRTCMKFRALQVVESGIRSETAKPRSPSLFHKSPSHPHDVIRERASKHLDHVRRELRKQSDPPDARWEDPWLQKEAISVHFKKLGQEVCSKLWDEYRNRRLHAVDVVPALREAWGPRSLNYYGSLYYRHSMVALLHCRTGAIGLNKELFHRSSRKHQVCPTLADYCESS